MLNIAKISIIGGAFLTILGSFLPWEREGDFISYLTYGLHIFPTLKDNGGLIIVLLSLSVLMLIFRPPKFIEKPLILSIVASLTLVLVCAFHITKLLISHANAAGVIGTPTIEIGLIMVSIGSILYLFAAVACYLKNLQ